MTKKKILVVYHYYPHYRMPVMKELAKDEDFDFSFVSGNIADTHIKTISSQEALSNGLKFSIIPNIWFFRKKLLWQKGLLKLCLSSTFDAIIFLANPHFISTWVATLLAHLNRKKVLFWGHFTIRNSWKNLLKIIFYHLADGLLLYGNYAKRQLINRGFKEDRAFVIYNSLDYDEQVRMREKINPVELVNYKRKLFTYPDLPIILFIGRLTCEKKLSQLIDVVEKLYFENIPTNLLVIGDGSEKNKLLAQIREKHLDHYVNFIGECYEEKKLSMLISLSDLCVSPGNVGLTAMHSMVYGVPVITHNNPMFQGPEFESIVSQETGDFFSYGSIDSMYEVVKKWLTENLSDKSRISNACMQMIERKYSPAIQFQKIHKALSIMTEK